MDTASGQVMPIRAQNDVALARQCVRTWAVQCGFSLVDQTKIVTAASELARNAFVHGGGGEMRVDVLQEGARTGLRLTFADRGPGIPDVELAMRDGYTTNRGMGLGLSGSRRLVNEFSIDSKPGEGTRVTIVKWR
jgi:serine/threonine-protein kinase RsbT